MNRTKKRQHGRLQKTNNDLSPTRLMSNTMTRHGILSQLTNTALHVAAMTVRAEGGRRPFLGARGAVASLAGGGVVASQRRHPSRTWEVEQGDLNGNQTC